MNSSKVSENILLGGFLLLILFVVTTAFIGVQRITHATENINKIVSEYDFKESLAIKIRNAARERSIVIWKIALSDDIFKRAEYYEEFLEHGTKFLKARAEMESTHLSIAEKNLIKTINYHAVQVTGIFRKEVEQLTADIDFKLDKKIILSGLPKQQNIITAIENLIAIQDEASRLAYSKITNDITPTIISLIVMIISSIIIGSLLVIFIGRRFNTMFSAIKKSESDLILLNSNLEHRVDERTHQLKEANTQLTKLAHFDSLTGLSNRIMLFQQIQNLVLHAKRKDEQFAVLFLDLDGFKSVNDIYGHDAGDFVLISIARLLTSLIRESDIVSRLGGDEFVIVLNNVQRENDSSIIAEKCINLINKPIVLEGTTIHVGTSIGISHYPRNSDNAETLIKYADKSMYKAKKSGKNNYSIYN